MRIKYHDRADKHVIDQIMAEAARLQYSIVKIDDKSGMIRLKKETVSVNIYTTTLAISTEIHHPKKGKTQLHRKNLTKDQIIKVLINPRTHTGKGYYKRKK